MIDPTFTPNFTDGLIIGALFIGWIRFEYRRALAEAELRKRKAGHVDSPRVVGQNFDNPNYLDWSWPR